MNSFNPIVDIINKIIFELNLNSSLELAYICEEFNEDKYSNQSLTIFLNNYDYRYNDEFYLRFYNEIINEGIDISLNIIKSEDFNINTCYIMCAEPQIEIIYDKKGIIANYINNHSIIFSK